MAVVVHHSALEPLRVTLASLADAVAALSLAYPGQQFDLVLLDNSCDVRYTASVKKLLDSLSLPHNLRLNYQQTAHNGGFGHGHNRALEQVDSRYHLILNPDVELAEDALLNA
ncbi:MAG: glycosyl transferase family 2, partial [Gammaproteobacteria bacterium]